MAIEFLCPVCQGTLQVPEESAGQVVRCGSCMSVLRVPAEVTEIEPEPKPPEPKPRRSSAEPVARRPRPRRPRPAPPTTSGGRSVLFWVVIALLGIGFLIVLGCAGVYLMLQPKWRMHHSERGGFQVELPAAAKGNLHEPIKLRNQPDIHSEGTFLPFEQEWYVVIYADLDPPARKLSDDAILDMAVAAMRKDMPGVDIIRDDTVKVGRFPGREVVFIHPTNHNMYFCRVVVAETRLYYVAAGGPEMGEDGNERIERFLNSFTITDPKILAKAQGRRELIDEGIRQARERGKVQPMPMPDRDRITEYDARELAGTALPPAMRIATPWTRRR